MKVVNRKVSVGRAVRDAKAEERKARRAMGWKGPVAGDGGLGKSTGVFTQGTHDSFQNLALKLGIGADNAMSQSTYGYYPITRVRVLLEWIHRGSWLGGIAVDVVADDMTREGIEITSSMPANDVHKLNEAMMRCGIWPACNEVIKWARLYGGAIGVLMIDGQDPTTELRIDTITKGQFRGILVLDRWMVDVSLRDLVFDPAWGMVPRYYTVLTQQAGTPYMKVHYSRVLRFEGVRLPWQQRLTENMWSLSVYERMYDRMVAFDSATMGVAQSLYKAYLRYIKVEQFRDIASVGGPQGEMAVRGLARYFDLIRKYQSIEGLTIIDSKDEFGTHQNQTFTGMSEGLLQLGQQLSGALQIPMVRLFGQSPAGLNSTGESDLRTYYDGIKAQQERTLRTPLDRVIRVAARSEGLKIPSDFAFRFRPLWLMTDKEKADVAEVIGRTVGDAYERGMVSQRVAVQELQQSSHDTGVFSNITPEDIDASENLIPTTLGGVDPISGELALPAPTPEEQAELEQTAKGGAAKPPPGKGKAGAGKDKDKGKKKARDYGLHLLGGRDYQGIPCVVEQPPGFDRKGNVCDGAAAYGYIRKTVGMDEECVDCFFGDDEDSFMCWIINQGEPDPEHKVLFGFNRWADALEKYAKAYPDYGPPVSVVGMPMKEFQTWLKDPENLKGHARRVRHAPAVTEPREVGVS